MVDIKYSQNFYTNKENLHRIIEAAGFSSKDLIIDIGAGKGVITKELIPYSTNIICYELDKDYIEILRDAFSKIPEVQIREEDFLEAKLPNREFKIFSNIPFSQTADIVRKITDSNSKFTQGYLFLQKESAERFVGRPKSTQISTILSSRFEISVVRNFERNDFKPMPDVDIVLLKMLKKDIEEKEFYLFRDFVTYIFNQRNASVLDTFKKLFTFKQLAFIKRYLKENGFDKPMDIPKEYYLEIFQYFKSNGLDYRKRVKDYYIRHSIQHIKREKVHRSRT